MAVFHAVHRVSMIRWFCCRLRITRNAVSECNFLSLCFSFHTELLLVSIFLLESTDIYTNVYTLAVQLKVSNETDVLYKFL